MGFQPWCMTIVGREVPAFSSDSIEWFHVSVSSTSVPPSHEISAPPTKDASSICAVGDVYFIWRIKETTPNVLEIVEFNTSSELAGVGLRIEFMSGLCPFALICKNEVFFPFHICNPFCLHAQFLIEHYLLLQYSSSSRNPYLLYTMSVSGVAYLIRLKGVASYESYSVIPPNEVVELNPQIFGVRGGITHIAAIAGIFVIGQPDGSVVCFRLGSLDITSPGFLHELRDDSIATRFLSLFSRRTLLAPVTDLICSEVRGRKHLFVLHQDGFLEVWDILKSHMLLDRATYMRLWPGDVYFHSYVLPLAILHKPNPEVDEEMISLYSLHLGEPGKIMYIIKPGRWIDRSNEASELNIKVEEGALIDVKLSSYKIWILKEDGLVLHNLAGRSESWKNEQIFGLQESVISEELFQSSEHAADDLLLLAHSLYSSAQEKVHKDYNLYPCIIHVISLLQLTGCFNILQEQVAMHVSSIFLRLLFLPGIFYHSVLRATLQDHNIHFTDSEFYSFTAAGMKKEIMSVIKNEATSRSPLSLLYCWKNFCSHYIDHWYRMNAPCGLLLDSSTGAVVLIRKSSVSLFRHLEEIEISYGSFTELGKIASNKIKLSGDLDWEVLYMVLECTNNISQQLGKGAPALFHESFFIDPSIFPEDILRRLLKVLKSGTSSSIASLYGSELGVDTWKKRVGDNKLHRKFCVNMSLSLQGLYRKALTWDKVIDVILLYCNSLVPQKYEEKSDLEAMFDIRTCITAHVTSEVSKVMFDSAVDIILLLNYMVDLSGMINMLPCDVSRVQRELFPLIQEILMEWHIVHFIGTIPCEAPLLDGLSSQLSLSEINSSANRRSWNWKLKKCDFPLAFSLMFDHPKSISVVDTRHLPNPSCLRALQLKFTSWIVWGTDEDGSISLSTRSTILALILLKHGHFDAVEHLLTTVNQNLLKKNISNDIQGENSEWCTILHLLGCCYAAQAHREGSQTSTNKKLDESISCFFSYSTWFLQAEKRYDICLTTYCFSRAAALDGASSSLHKLSNAFGLWHLHISDDVSPKAWTLHYYNWVMQLFEQYNMSAGARQFAIAALEQVDEVLGIEDIYSGADFENESPILTKVRLWANVFKFSLDLNNYKDAYSAIIMNPDEESKCICLRHFINVLFEHNAIKILCDGSLPFVGLAEKVEQELALKAKLSDVSAKPHPFKILYAFAINRRNWRKAASYMYLYSSKLKSEAAVRAYEFRSFALQERLNCLSATINALYLLSSDCAWISTLHPDANDTFSSEKSNSCMDIEKLEKEYILTSAEQLLWMKNIEWSFTGIERPPSNLIELLVQSNLYDMVFTVILRFFTGSRLEGELERVFSAMSRNCCLSRNDTKKQDTFLASKDEVASAAQHSKGNDQWDALKQYTGIYKSFHPRLPVIVAETLLSANSLMKLPLWLVEMFKGTPKGTLGMAGSESSPALLFQLYVDYGRYAEATNLVLHYLESVSSLQPEDVIRRKKPSAVWFPYTTIERLKSKLDELINSGQMVAECEKQRNLLETTLLKHFQLLQSDSHDVKMSFATS
ncbi:nucleoporin [Artemisia annua]|uniref:Nucleoporin n=1 Tax=Artemisia annua TaxID=35608 RepID=A0A2U1N4D9_ARTAN|nr:nucleoporin [Artemisia annua]